MNIDLKDKKNVSVLLLGVAAMLCLFISIKAVCALTGCWQARSAVVEATENSKPDANSVEKYFAQPKEIVKELKAKNLFAPPPPPKSPISQVWGILGDEVLIEGKWYKVGDKVGDAEITGIGAEEVEYTWQGKEMTASPIQAGQSHGFAAAPGRGERQGPQSRQMIQGPGGRPERMGEGGRRGGPGGFFGSLTEEQRQEMMQMRQRFENASSEERERMRAEMRERFGGGGR